MTSRLAPLSQWSTRATVHICTVSLALLAFVLVQLEVPDPYLDEIFHIPQTQRYCDEEFEYWDPAITTPPGLYLLSAIPLMTVHVSCTVPLLRGTNLLFSAFVLPGLLSALLEPIPVQPLWRHFLWPSSDALVVSTFPLISFFSNLYYTDVASLAGVLGCLALARRGRHWSAVLVGIWSMTVRQTNVIWVAFTLATCLLDEAARLSDKKLEDRSNRPFTTDCLLGDLEGPGQVVALALKALRVLLQRWRSLRWMVLPYVLPFGGFLAFLKWNGGIVLGHKDQHKVSVHLPQLLYFLAFASVLLLPTLLAEGLLPSVRGSLFTGLGSIKKLLASLVGLTGMLLAIRNFTIWHPFLLADNRHYMFYLLRRVFLRYPTSKYAVAPLYLFASWTWLWRLRRNATILWTLGFVGCSSLVLVPSPLIEPRYFLIPTILLRLQLSPPRTPTRSAGGWKAEYAWYALINAATIGLFLIKKFRWEGWEGWMRFMW